MKKIAAPIDNKNLMDDPFEDEVFCDGFMHSYDHRDGKGTRHLIGTKDVVEDGVVNETGLVDVCWKWGDNCVHITLLAVSGCFGLPAGSTPEGISSTTTGVSLRNGSARRTKASA